MSFFIHFELRLPEIRDQQMTHNLYKPGQPRHEEGGNDMSHRN